MDEFWCEFMRLVIIDYIIVINDKQVDNKFRLDCY